MAIATLENERTSKKQRNNMAKEMPMKAVKKAPTVMISEREMRKAIEQKRARSEALKRIEEQRKKRREEMLNKDRQMREERKKLVSAYYTQFGVREPDKNLTAKQDEPLGWHSSAIKESEELFKQISREWGMDFKVDDRR